MLKRDQLADLFDTAYHRSRRRRLRRAVLALALVSGMAVMIYLIERSLLTIHAAVLSMLA